MAGVSKDAGRSRCGRAGPWCVLRDAPLHGAPQHDAVGRAGRARPDQMPPAKKIARPAKNSLTPVRSSSTNRER